MCFMITSSVASQRGGGGGIETPTGLKSLQNTTFLGAFEANLCSKNENSPPPRWNWRAEVVKDLQLFGLEKWSFFFFWTAPKIGQEN